MSVSAPSMHGRGRERASEGGGIDRDRERGGMDRDRERGLVREGVSTETGREG